jgi:hypothetical protein
MYERLKGLFDRELLNEDMLRIAVTKSWITPEEFEEISGVVYI